MWSSAAADVSTFVRVRPLSRAQVVSGCHPVVDCPTSNDVIVHDDQHGVHQHTKFTFDEVFDPKCKQADVYNSVVDPMVPDVMAGRSCTVFAFEHCGCQDVCSAEEETAGKLDYLDPLLGVIPRAMNHILREVNASNIEYCVKVSFVQLFDEESLDLLSHPPNNKIQISEVLGESATTLTGMHEVPVRNMHEVYDMLYKSSSNRRSLAVMNSGTAGCHTVFSVAVSAKERQCNGEEELRTGRLHIIDLALTGNGKAAGQERGRGCGRECATTAAHIMQCLSNVDDQSKIMRVLMQMTRDTTRISVLATVSAAASHVRDTLTVLKCVKHVNTWPKCANEQFIEKYVEDIDRLRSNLMSRKMHAATLGVQEDYNHILTEIERQKQNMVELLKSMKSLDRTLVRREVLSQDLNASLAKYQEELTRSVTSKRAQEIGGWNDVSKKAVVLHCVEGRDEHLGKSRTVMDTVHGPDKAGETLRMKRSLERENTIIFQNFHAALLRELHALENAVEAFTLKEMKFSDDFHCEQGEQLEKILSHAKVLEVEVSSLLNDHIEKTQELDDMAQEMTRIRDSVCGLKCDAEVETVDAMRKVVALIRNSLQVFDRVHEQNNTLRNQIKAMESDFEERFKDQNDKVMTFIDVMGQEVERLYMSGSEQLAQLQDQIDRTDLTDSMLQHTSLVYYQDMCKEVQEVSHHMQLLKGVMEAYWGDSHKEFAQLNENITRQRACKESISCLIQDFQGNMDSYEEFISRCKRDSVAHTIDLKQLTTESLSTIEGIDEECMSMASHVREVQDTNMARWEAQARRMTDGLEAIMERLSMAQDQHLQRCKGLVATLQRAKMHHGDIQQVHLANLATLEEATRLGRQSHTSWLETWRHSVALRIDCINRSVVHFVTRNLFPFLPTGDIQGWLDHNAAPAEAADMSDNMDVTQSKTLQQLRQYRDARDCPLMNKSSESLSSVSSELLLDADDIDFLPRRH